MDGPNTAPPTVISGTGKPDARPCIIVKSNKSVFDLEI